MKYTDPIALAFALGLFALVPLLVITTTSFLKIAIVLSLVRNALGVQQAPPNIAIYALALLMSVYIMAPVGAQILASVENVPDATFSVEAMARQVKAGAEPMRNFLVTNS